MILAELTEAGLTSSRILNQVCDGVFAVAEHCGEVQHLLQERENKEVFYVHCLNHRLHLVVVYAMSIEQAINDFSHVWGSPYYSFSQTHSYTSL